MKNRIKIILFMLLFTTLLFSKTTDTTAESTTIKIPAKISTDTVSIGEPFFFSVKIPHETGVAVTPADTAEWLKSVRVRGGNVNHTDSSTEFIYQLSVYQAPICSIPSFKYFLKSTSKTDSTATQIDTAVSNAGAIWVRSNFSEGDTLNSATFHPPMSAGSFPYWVVLVLIAIALIIWLIIKLIKKKNGGTLLKTTPPPIPPYDEAIEALRQLKGSTLVEQGEFKTFVFGLSEILKRYIGRRYICQVQESTSTEFKKWLKGSPLKKEQKNLLEQFVNGTDVVKFAEMKPSQSSIEEWLSQVELFCKDTKPADEIETLEDDEKSLANKEEDK
jgi:hypothetical protein